MCRIPEDDKDAVLDFQRSWSNSGDSVGRVNDIII